MFLSLLLGFCVDSAHEPLPVGETGKGKGDRPACSEHRSGDTDFVVAGVEGRGPVTHQTDISPIG
jgi:hypothetical protein